MPTVAARPAQLYSMTMKQLTVLLLLMTGVVGTGCAGLKSPETRVLGVAVTQRSAEGARVELMVELNNPNATALPLRHSNYRVRMGERSFSFKQRLDVTLPGHGTQRITLPAAFADGAAIGPDTPYQVSGSVTYEPPGEFRRILTDMRIPLPSRSFSAAGQLE